MVTTARTAQEQYQHYPAEGLLRDLGAMLKSDGFGTLCSRPGSKGRPVPLETSLGLVAIIWAMLAAGFATTSLLGGAPVVVSLLAGFGYFALVLGGGRTLARRWPPIADVVAWSVVILLPATFVYQVVADGVESTRTSHLLTFGVALLALALSPLSHVQRLSPKRLSGVGKVLAAAPWLMPITLLIVVVPLFSQDLWQLASETHFLTIVELSVVTVVPMVLFVLWRLLYLQFAEVVTGASTDLKEKPGEASALVMEELALHGKGLPGLAADLRRAWRKLRRRPRLKPADAGDERIGTTLSEAYGSPSFDYYVNYVGTRLSRTFGLQILARVVLLVCSIAVGSTLYIYLIAWITISAERAQVWGDRAEESTRETFLGFAVATGPHLWVAGLMAVISTAVFLALVITTQEMEQAFHQTATRGPLKRCLAVAVPFAKLFADEGRDETVELLTPSGSHAVSGIASPKYDLVSPGRTAQWFRWRAPGEGRVTLEAEGDEWETSVAVYVEKDSGLSPVAPALHAGQSANGRFRFRAEPDETYRIVVDGFHEWAEGDEDAFFHFHWLLNDDAGAAHPISGESGTTMGHNRYASRQEHEPAHAGIAAKGSVWYRWRAPAARRVTFNTAGSSFDTVLAVYRGGPDVESLVEVASNDDAEGLNLQSRVEFDAEKDEEYLIAVDRYSGEPGSVVLNWGPPENDRLEDARRLEGPGGQLYDNNTGATREPWEPAHAGEEGGASVWYLWRAPAAGLVTFTSAGRGFATLLALYGRDEAGGLHALPGSRNSPGVPASSELRVEVAEEGEYLIALDGLGGATGDVWLSWYYLPPNDDLAAAAELDESSGIVNAHNRGATKELGEPDHAGRPGGASIWYRWRAAVTATASFEVLAGFPVVLAVYRGSAIDDLEQIASSAEGGRVLVPAVEDETYLIAVDGVDAAVGDIVLMWHSPPRNNDVANAERIDGTTGSVSGHNRGAVKEPGEPDHAGVRGGASVWYRWRAPGTGEARFDTLGSSFDTLLAVYEGQTVSDLAVVAANDDAPGLGILSRVRFPARDGTDYLIAVDGYGDAVGDLTLNWELATPPGNARFEAATPIGGASGRENGSNRAASRQEGEPLHAGVQGGASVWFRWRAPADGEATFHTDGSEFDTVLAAYRGTRLADLREAAANDDADAGVLWSQISFPVDKDELIWIALDGYAGATGGYVLKWELASRSPA